MIASESLMKMKTSSNHSLATHYGHINSNFHLTETFIWVKLSFDWNFIWLKLDLSESFIWVKLFAPLCVFEKPKTSSAGCFVCVLGPWVHSMAVMSENLINFDHTFVKSLISIYVLVWQMSMFKISLCLKSACV